MLIVRSCGQMSSSFVRPSVRPPSVHKISEIVWSVLLKPDSNDSYYALLLPEIFGRGHQMFLIKCIQTECWMS